MSNKKLLGERLVAVGFITEGQLSEALGFQKTNGGRLGDVLIEKGFIAEQSLLRFLAAEYQTRYVSSTKLAKVKIPSEIVDRIPVQMAEQAYVLPIRWSGVTQTLSVVMAEPQNLQLIEEVKLVSDSKQLVAYITSRSAVIAGIRKHYYGDISAFNYLAIPGKDTREDVRGLVEYYPYDQNAPAELSLSNDTSSRHEDSFTPSKSNRVSGHGVVDEVRRTSLTSDNDFIETLNVLVGLLELPRGRFKGHSASVAKLTRVISRRMGLSERETNHNIIAAYLHDIGKKVSRHITLPKIKKDPSYRNDALNYYRIPSRLFDSVHLPVEVNTILGRLYEAWDGSGVPDGLKGNAIPLGARIIATIDTYEDLTRIPSKKGEEPLGKDLALGALEPYEGNILDPQLVDLLRHVLTGDLMRQKLLAEGKHIIVIEPDPENSSLLEINFTRRGFIVTTARDSHAALENLRDGADLIISETKLPKDDGFALLSTIRQDPAGRNVPIVFLTSDTRPESKQQALSMGAVDLVTKPYSVESFMTKVCRHLDATVPTMVGIKTIRGTLDELPPVEVIRVLCGGKRTGLIRFKAHRKVGEVFLTLGMITHATYNNASGEEALTGVLSIRAGEFHFDPTARSSEQTISGSSEELLDKALKRLRK